MFFCIVFFFKQKTAYEMRISDWSSDVCSSDLALRTVVEEKLVKRGVSLKGLDYGTVEEATQNTVRQTLTIAVGISSDKAREINRMIKEKAPKGVSSQTQGESVRVNGKKRDDLQAAITLLKDADLGIPLQFNNFR